MKRISVCLSFLLLLSILLTVYTYADEIETGVLGDHVTYTFNRTRGLVQVSGTGEIWDFDPDTLPAEELLSNDAPWSAVGRVSPLAGDGDVRHIALSDGITRIGSCAFYHCPIRDVSFGDDISEIGALAFARTALQAVQFPKSLTRLEEKCFAGCDIFCAYFLGDAPDFCVNSQGNWEIFSQYDPKMGGIKLFYTPEAKGWPVKEKGFRDDEQFVMPYRDVSIASAGQFYALSVSSWLNGVGDQQFCPDEAATRAQLVSALYRIHNGEAKGRKRHFRDVDEAAWYADAMQWAVAQKMIKVGFFDRRTYPEQPVTRQELAMMLYSLSGQKEKPEEQTALGDWEDVSDSAKSAVSWARLHLLSMYGERYQQRFGPNETITRGSMAKILLDYVQHCVEKE